MAQQSRRYLSVSILAVLTGLLFFGGAPKTRDGTPLYKDPSASVEKRVDDLLGRMTLQEKISMLGGTGFTTTPIPRLGIPPLRMTDGPVGVRRGKATAFPCGTCLAATWDTSMIYEVGQAIGEEVRGKGLDVILGPCVNIARIPMGGRTFEGYGEDPYLTSRMAVSYIEGVQSEDVAATIKHFAANNQEYERGFVNEIISHRILNEIYLPAFKAAVEEAHVMCVMAAYNKVNGEYCTENNYLLNTKLKDDWGFNGIAMSDWGAVHSSIAVANGGLDLEMPTGQYLNDSTLLPAVKSGEVKISTIDDKVRRILSVMFELGLFDHQRVPDSSLVNSPEHRQVAYKAAVEGIVLLKNEDNVLPLNLNKIKSIAVIGPNAAEARTGGGGSALVNPVYSVSPLEALEARLKGKVKINYVEGVSLQSHITPVDSSLLYLPNENKHGFKVEYFDNENLTGEPKASGVDHQIYFNWNGESPVPGIPAEHFSARWTGRLLAPGTGTYILEIASDDGSRLYVNDKLVIDNWGNHAVQYESHPIRLEKGRFYRIRIDYFQGMGGSALMFGLKPQGSNIDQAAVKAAKESDIALLFVGTSDYYETEGKDRDNLRLPVDQDKLIKEVAAANKNTVVINISGAPVVMDGWVNKVPGLLQAWFGGDEAGNAIADMLLGKYDPSGRLPITFPKRWRDCSAYGSYRKQDSVSDYTDGIFVGYRWFDKKNIAPLFPFGFGLSYTKFAYSDFKILSNKQGDESNYKISFNIKNVGGVAGVEIPQLYVHDTEEGIIAPVKELKRFDRVSLQPGETTTVTFELTQSDFAHYDGTDEKWITHPGKYQVMVGSSSRDIQLRGELNIQQ